METLLLSYSAEEPNITEATDMAELKETSRSSESSEQSGQGTQQSTFAKEPVPGRVGLQASFTSPNIPLFKEVNPIY